MVLCYDVDLKHSNKQTNQKDENKIIKNVIYKQTNQWRCPYLAYLVFGVFHVFGVFRVFGVFHAVKHLIVIYIMIVGLWVTII